MRLQVWVLMHLKLPEDMSDGGDAVPPLHHCPLMHASRQLQPATLPYERPPKEAGDFYVCICVHCPGDQLRANRQGSVYTDLSTSSQNIAIKRKTVPSESTTCICFTAIKMSHTEQVH